MDVRNMLNDGDGWGLIRFKKMYLYTMGLGRFLFLIKILDLRGPLV